LGSLQWKDRLQTSYLHCSYHCDCHFHCHGHWGVHPDGTGQSYVDAARQFSLNRSHFIEMYTQYLAIFQVCVNQSMKEIFTESKSNKFSI
jgi:hypothetical protein